MYLQDSGTPPNEATAVVTIRGDDVIQFTDIPRFEKPLYLGFIDETGKLNLDDIILEESTYSSSIKFELDEDIAEFFEIQQNENVVTLILSSPLDDDFLQDKFTLNLVLRATHPTVESGSTAIVIELPKKNIQVPEFEKSLYEGEITKDLLLEMEDVTLKQFDGENITLIGPDSVHFTIAEVIENVVVIEFNSVGLPESVLSQPYLAFTIVAIDTDGLEGHAAIVIKTPYSTGISDNVEETLIIVEVNELGLDENLIPAKLGDCSYDIVSFTPNNKGNHTELDEIFLN